MGWERAPLDAEGYANLARALARRSERAGERAGLQALAAYAKGACLSPQDRTLQIEMVEFGRRQALQQAARSFLSDPHELVVGAEDEEEGIDVSADASRDISAQRR